MIFRQKDDGGSILNGTQLLNIDCLHHLLTVDDRRLLESLTATQLFNDAGLFKFALEFLERTFDVLAFFNWYDDHC